MSADRVHPDHRPELLLLIRSSTFYVT
jgi:hypothetical protein